MTTACIPLLEEFHNRTAGPLVLSFFQVNQNLLSRQTNNTQKARTGHVQSSLTLNPEPSFFLRLILSKLSTLTVIFFFFFFNRSHSLSLQSSFHKIPLSVCSVYIFWTPRASLVAQMVKNPPAVQETWFHPWFGKIPWRRKWQPTPVFLPGESPWTEELGRLQFMGSQRVRHD